MSEILPIQNGVQIVTISKNPPVFKVAASKEGATVEIFATALKQCGVKDFTPSKATTRELFVGFEKLDVISQETAELGGHKVFRSELTATLDDQPVEMVDYTVRSPGCVSDLAFWKSSAESSPADLRALIEGAVIGGAPHE